MAVTVYEGLEADKFLKRSTTPAAWDELFRSCPWSHTYQSRQFVSTWYDVYRPSYDPVLVADEPRPGLLTGLMPLARHIATGQLSPAGPQDAEYQGWLTVPGEEADFPRQALAEVTRRYPRQTLVFRYLSPGTPVGWLSEAGHGLNIELEPWNRPLMWVSEDSAGQSLRKSSNKSRMNRLGRLGPLSFERIARSADLAAIIDQIAAYADVRHGAVHGTLPFANYHFRRGFLLRLLDAGVLHATVFRAGDLLLSAQLNVVAPRQLVLHIITQMPLYPRLSAGKLHLLQLVRMLAAEGIESFDLTPGGDAYKDNAADSYATVHVLKIFGSRRLHRSDMRLKAAADVVRQCLRSVRVEPRLANEACKKLMAYPVGRLPLVALKRAGCWTRRVVRHRIYQKIMDEHEPAAAQRQVNRNAAGDLLKYQPCDQWPRLQDFLSHACEQFRHDAHCYTICDNNRLQHCVWAVGQSDRVGSSPALPQLVLPEGSACLFGLRTVRQKGGPELLGQVVREALHDLWHDGYRTVLAAAEAGDSAACSALEEEGFEQVETITETCTLGRTSHRRSNVTSHCSPVARKDHTADPPTASAERCKTPARSERV